MKALRENQLISIVLNGAIRLGRIRCCDPDGTQPLYLDVRGQRIDLSQLTPETEGIKWARGRNTEAAKALAVSLALDDKTEVTPKTSWKSAFKAGVGALAVKNPATTSLKDGFTAFLGGFLADVAFQTAEAESSKSTAPALPPKPPKP